MRHAPTIVFLALFVLVATVPIVAADPESPGTPWHGILPAPAATLEAGWFTCRVLDAQTLEPIQGARWVRTPEWCAGWRVRHDHPLGVAITNADGIAWLETTPGLWEDDCHWLVTADGYGFTHDYGELPPTEVLLEPEVHFHGRLLDPLGRPVAGGLVEILGGCSHGTAAVSGTTDGEGRFDLAGIAPSLPGQIWVAGRGIASDLVALDGPASLGGGEVVLAMETGVRYVGRCVDLLGAPLQGVVVRAWNEQRGPATASGPDGWFTLDGAEEGARLTVFPRADLTNTSATFHVEDCWPAGTPTPLTIQLSPLGVVETEDLVALRVRAVDEGGEPVPGLLFGVVSETDGRGPEGWTADEDEGTLACGEAVEEVRRAPAHVVPSDAFAPVTFAPVRVPDPTAPVVVHVSPQPRLSIHGTLPEDARLTLSVPGASCSIEEDPPWLPWGAPAALRVEIDGRPPFFFPVGPAVDDVRTVRVALPEPRTIVLPPDARYVGLKDGERDAYLFEGDEPGVFHTDASGRLEIRWSDANMQSRSADIRVPEEPGARVVVAAPPGHGVTEKTCTVHAREPDGASFESNDVVPGDLVIFEREGWVTLRGIARFPTTDLHWGPCALRLEIRDEDGPVDALVMVDGAIHAAPEGVLALKGLTVGPHRIVVARRDVVAEGRVLTLTPVPDEATETIITLPLD